MANEFLGLLLTAEDNYVCPTQIYFSHHDVNAMFSDCKKSIKDIFLTLYNKEITPPDVGAMKVVWHDCKMVALSNRRLAVYLLLHLHGKQCGGQDFKVRVEVVDKPPNFAEKYSTQCGGEYAYIRGTDYCISRHPEQTRFNPFDDKLRKDSLCSCGWRTPFGSQKQKVLICGGGNASYGCGNIITYICCDSDEDTQP